MGRYTGMTDCTFFGPWGVEACFVMVEDGGWTFSLSAHHSALCADNVVHRSCTSIVQLALSPLVFRCTYQIGDVSLIVAGVRMTMVHGVRVATIFYVGSTSLPEIKPFRCPLPLTPSSCMIMSTLPTHHPLFKCKFVTPLTGGAGSERVEAITFKLLFSLEVLQ